MKIRHGNPLDLEAAAGETLGLSFDSPEGAAVISFDAPGGTGTLAPGATHQFVVEPMAGRTFCLLAVNCTFKTTGTCELRVADAAGTVARHTLTTAHGLISRVIVFAIDVAPAAAPPSPVSGPAEAGGR